MSYSFSVRAATKAEAKEKVATELAKVVMQQPIHAVDQDQANAAATSFIDLLRDDETQDVMVSVNGSVYIPTAGLQQASVSVSAGLATKG